MKISLIGSGLMGFPMAEKILVNNYELSVYNRSTEKAKPLELLGAHITKDINEAVQKAETIILMLSDYHAIKETIYNDDVKEIINNKCIIQMGTISPVENNKLLEFCSSNNCEYLEAPVLGSINEVKNGNLIILVGGQIDLYEKYRFIFELFGKNINYIGEVGKASALKLALNQLIVSLTTAFSISLSYIKKNEIDTELFMEIVRKSALYAPTFDKKLSNYENQNFDNTNFPLQHMLKDVNLIINEVDRFDIDSGILGSVEQIIKKALEKGYKDKDYSSLYMGVYDK